MDLANPNPNPQVALFASPGMGHLIPLVALSERLFSLHGFHSTIFVASTEASTTTVLHSLHLPSAIRIVHLSPPDISAFVTAQTAVVSRVSITVRESMPAFRDALAAMSPKPSVLIVEMFGTYTFPIAEEQGIPKYVYIPTTAAFLALTVYLPTLHKEIEGEYVDMQEPIYIPSCRPIRVEDLVDPMMDRKDDQYENYVYMGNTLPLADAIMINTWEDLEPTTLRAIREDPLLRRIMPLPVYPVGPIVRSSGEKSRAECMAWLDEQPMESVIYVSLGSGGTLSEEQLTEFAFGLELSGKRFPWVVRPPTGKDGAFFKAGRDGGDGGDGLSRYLPDGFLTRTRGVGLVVPLWAPQLEVLSHPSIGGFLSHCGWNSTLESMVNGVPMIAWPLYSEQKMNAAILEEEVGVAVRTKELPTKRVVGREEIEKLVRLVMEKEGEAMRRRMKEVKESGLRAVGDGGSSWDWLSHVAQQWKIGYLHAKEKAGKRRQEGEIDATRELVVMNC
ncbi:anthocyanidin 3-O-glucosyltransferase 5-like [Macadamia integrifolia]|uniref:anthocyanidin 3-O-glucosyltransferase 5-like n=1 Tax=Macadamia integrifolia TaxID=60698 RepID=UPI001C4E88DF|nr:anthocyanidin 3-O-glucosyltransferase 5-like [Macadamia integrifolia]